MRNLLLAILLALPCLNAQYTWHTSTNVAPPDPNQWMDLSSHSFSNAGFLATTATGGGVGGSEVRSTVIRTPNAIHYSYEHLLGWYNAYDWNTGMDRWIGYRVVFYEYPPYFPMQATIYYRGLSGTTQLAVIPMNSIPDGTILSTSIRRVDGPNGPGAGIYIRAGNQVYYYRDTTAPNSSYNNGFHAPLGMSATFSEVRVGHLETTPPNNPTSLSSTITTGFSLRRGMRRRMM